MDNLADPSILISKSKADAIRHTALEHRLNASVEINNEGSVTEISASPRDIPWFRITIRHMKPVIALDMIEDAIGYVRENQEDLAYPEINRAITQLRKGEPISVSKEFWPKVRTEIQKQASWWIDHKQDIYAIIALEEVKRLDEMFRSESTE